ncbi:GNAT family N-acetyltransferase [Thalassomonas actiniarum]|nr:GNAT family N-acetyltransferase [Thalassomonas actiniarum]
MTRGNINKLVTNALGALKMDIHFQKGWDIAQAHSVALLYEEAFGVKFSSAIPDRLKRVEIIAKSFVPEFSFAAINKNGVVGLAGFQVLSGSLTGGIGATQLINDLGFWKGTWACMIFSLFERKPSARELVMDGIAVNAEFRGQGIGSELLDHIIDYASENGFESVRLDVIDSNPRARKLYESKGFVVLKTEYFPYLQRLIGFSGSTTMVLPIKSCG